MDQNIRFSEYDAYTTKIVLQLRQNIVFVAPNFIFPEKSTRTIPEKRLTSII